MTWQNTNDLAWKERARRVIPKGMYGHESTAMLPADYPQFFARAHGTRLWDTDGHEYIDYMCAYGPNLFGYGHPEVEAAAAAQARIGDTMTGPSPVMVELAEDMVAQVGHADWAMFCKNGTDATSLALMCARAHADRPKVLVAQAAYHGAAAWCQPGRKGVVPGDTAELVYYRHNDVESLNAAVALHHGKIAGIFATPFRHEVFADQTDPDPAYARAVRAACDAEEALLIIDDVRAGFRLARDCSWSVLGVEPDLCCWGKVLANGHALSALTGRAGVRAAAERIFSTGSFWFSAVPMAAGRVVLRLVRETDYLERSLRLGQALRDGLTDLAGQTGFELRQTGPVQMPQILFAEDPDMRLGYRWGALMLRNGVYMHPYHNMFLNAAMTEDDIALTLEAARKAFRDLAQERRTLCPNDNQLVRNRLALAV